MWERVWSRQVPTAETSCEDNMITWCHCVRWTPLCICSTIIYVWKPFRQHGEAVKVSFLFKDTFMAAASWRVGKRLSHNSIPTLSNIRFLHKLICPLESKSASSNLRTLAPCLLTSTQRRRKCAAKRCWCYSETINPSSPSVDPSFS